MQTFLGVRHAFLPHYLGTMGKEADVSEAGKRDEPLRTSAWEATEFKSPLFKVFIRGLNGLLHLISVSLSVEDLPFLLTPFNLKRLNKIAFSSENFLQIRVHP